MKNCQKQSMLHHFRLITSSLPQPMAAVFMRMAAIPVLRDAQIYKLATGLATGISLRAVQIHIKDDRLTVRRFKALFRLKGYVRRVTADRAYIKAPPDRVWKVPTVFVSEAVSKTHS